MVDKNNKEIDQVTGVETTGHSWDGLKELNNPLPRWWLWIFYITIIWSIGYWVVYPAWPTLSGNTEGKLKYSQYEALKTSQAEMVQRQAAYIDQFERATLDEILDDEELYAFANAGGRAAFKDNCATCHGTGAAGSKGYPNLNDDDWLWGGTVYDIHQTLQYGIRANNDDTRVSMMLGFGEDGLLTKEEIQEVVKYVRDISGQEFEGSSEKGSVIFKQNCTSCHGDNGKGKHEFGAPNLTDAIWLYGGDVESLYETIYYGRAGMMPAWDGRLDDNMIKQLAIYVHQLGGGEESGENEETDFDALGEKASGEQAE